MDWANKYWKIILTVFAVSTSFVTLQLQAAQNAKDISANKADHDKSDAAIILLVQKEAEEIKSLQEKQFAEAKKEREKIKAKQEKTTVMEVKIDYIQKEIKSNKDVLNEILQEMRSKK